MMNNNESKIPEEFKIEPKTELGKKLDNFWYYNKWKVIVALFVLFIIVICVVQCTTRDKCDVQLLYGGALSSSDPITEEMRSALTKIEPENIGDDGVALNVLEIYDDEYVKANQDKVSVGVNKTNYENFCNLITSGEYSVLIMDKWIYDEIKDKVGFRAIDDVVGAGIVSDDVRYDSCAVYLKKTAFAKRFDGAFATLSDDTVICLCIYSPYKATLSCGDSVDADYKASEEMFKSILTYK